MTEVLLQAVRFGGVGLLNTAIGLAGIYGAMFFLGTGPALSNAIGYVLGLSVSFSLNRAWTFASSSRTSHALPRYLLVVCASYLLNLTAVVVAADRFSTSPYLAQVLGIAIYTSCVFLGCRWFVFPARTT
jgi:putative flippase GtrA